MESQQSQRYRGIGSQLADFLQSSGGSFPDPGVLQGVVADLTASNEELIIPLKALVSHPGFRALVAIAGSGKGNLQRQALLQDLTATFSAQMISALSDVLGGILALPEEASNCAAASTGRLRHAPAAHADIPQEPNSKTAYTSTQDVGPKQATIAEEPKYLTLNKRTAFALTSIIVGVPLMSAYWIWQVNKSIEKNQLPSQPAHENAHTWSHYMSEDDEKGFGIGDWHLDYASKNHTETGFSIMSRLTYKGRKGYEVIAPIEINCKDALYTYNHSARDIYLDNTNIFSKLFNEQCNIPEGKFNNG